MNTVKHALWLLFALMALTYSSWYFNNSSKLPLLDDETLSSTVDTTIAHLTVRQFNEQGALVNLLTTPSLKHIPKQNIHLLDTPYIIVKQVNEPAWEIRSKKATSYEGGQRIIFQNKVIVHQSPSDKTQESTLKTEEVTYFPQEKKAVTDQFVTFEQSGNFVESVGMNAYLDEKRVELLHSARGSYAPAKG